MKTLSDLETPEIEALFSDLDVAWKDLCRLRGLRPPNHIVLAWDGQTCLHVGKDCSDTTCLVAMSGAAQALLSKIQHDKIAELVARN